MNSDWLNKKDHIEKITTAMMADIICIQDTGLKENQASSIYNQVNPKMYENSFMTNKRNSSLAILYKKTIPATMKVKNLTDLRTMKLPPQRSSDREEIEKQLCQLIKSYQRKKYKIVVTGDLNDYADFQMDHWSTNLRSHSQSPLITKKFMNMDTILLLPFSLALLCFIFIF